VSGHQCTFEGCENGGKYVAGYYVVGVGRRVRVWMCTYHYMKTGTYAGEVARPPHIEAAEQAEREYYARKEEEFRRIPIDRDNRSVRHMPSNGHGEPVIDDRIKSWRWGGF